jgi:hypothetical protein
MSPLRSVGPYSLSLSASQLTEDPVELAFEIAMRIARSRDHVVDTLPDLVEAIKTRSTPTLEQLTETGCRRIQDQRTHTHKAYQRRCSIHLA